LTLKILVFGPKKLPELGRGLGDGIRGFKAAMSGDDRPVTTVKSEVKPEPAKPEPTKLGTAEEATKTA
jgi:sec-independent protein translocase protein TatA